MCVGIDHIPELVEWSRDNVARDGKQALLDSGNLQLHVRDGFGGFAEAGPYDAIHVGAAPETIPDALKQQLKPGGVLLLPVGPNGGCAHCDWKRHRSAVLRRAGTGSCSLTYLPFVHAAVSLSRLAARSNLSA